MNKKEAVEFLEDLIKKEEIVYCGMFEALQDGCDNLIYKDACYTCDGKEGKECYIPSQLKRQKMSIYGGEYE